jgi:integrase/recombinase XerD
MMLLTETGMRSGEAWNLQWTDFDFERGTVRVTPEKGGRPRVLKISQRLDTMLKALPTWNTEQRPFGGSLKHFARTFRKNRTKAAHKVGNPRINQIHFHTLRHYKATMEYHETKDILHVQEMLGHRNIQSTLTYTHLVNFEEDEYTCHVAETVKEAKELVEAGFQFVCDFDQVKLFKKRK